MYTLSNIVNLFLVSAFLREKKCTRLLITVIVHWFQCVIVMNLFALGWFSAVEEGVGVK